jgi:superfamily II DNA or RNA helicase
MAASKAQVAQAMPSKAQRAIAGTPYHAKYYAHEITRQAAGGDKDRLTMSLYDAVVDLNPHQIEAGLFALRSPLSKGVILADEVGLGKTIEAGLVLTQFWAERKRRLLIICPASIRKQWSFELESKFNLPNKVHDALSYREAKRRGRSIFEGKNVVIVSYHFASKMKDELAKVFWDLVVLDEAHRLRNVHTKSAKMAQNIQGALGDCRKLLLTATPLQNSLLELYGMASFIDDRIFGDKRSFQAQYKGESGDLADLRARIAPFVSRTLRKDVQEYIRFTERVPMTEKFDPAQPEVDLYEKVSEFIQRPDTYALPYNQKQLVGMVLRKILASSSEALVGTLTAIKERLEGKRGGQPEVPEVAADLVADEAVDEDEVEEYEDEAEAEKAPEALDDVKLAAEIQELEGFIALARSIKVDSKTHALLKGITAGFAKMGDLGANRKALIFTESRRTQRYLKAFLDANGYAGKIVQFNGTNNSPEQSTIYNDWVKANAKTGRVSGSKGIDMRTALMEHFRDTAEIMLATESAAEGVNLQFCSLVINYDLPWNPQRIEQRIGRCHRYGQKHDVVVINFLNQKNQADVRVFELLEHKFKLFDGVFGSSDEVLGAIGNGVDFEQRVFQIVQQCRTAGEINAAFDKLRKELESQIDTRMMETRQKLLEHFDQEVQARLKVNLPDAMKQLDQVEHYFWTTTKVILANNAEFDDENLTFKLHSPPEPAFKVGEYRLIRKERGEDVEAGEFLYRLSHPLGEYVLDAAKAAATPAALVTFDLANHPTKISVLKEFQGKKGWLSVRKLTVTAFSDEEHVLFTGLDEEGNALEPEVMEKLLLVGAAEVKPRDATPPEVVVELTGNADVQVTAKLHEVLEHNEAHFGEEQDRIERWAKDKILSAERELQEEKDRIEEFGRLARMANNLQERLATMKKQQAAEANLNNHQRKIWEAQDEIRRVRNNLIDELQARLKQKTTVQELFTIAWKVA